MNEFIVPENIKDIVRRLNKIDKRSAEYSYLVNQIKEIRNYLNTELKNKFIE